MAPLEVSTAQKSMPCVSALADAINTRWNGLWRQRVRREVEVRWWGWKTRRRTSDSSRAQTIGQPSAAGLVPDQTRHEQHGASGGTRQPLNIFLFISSATRVASSAPTMHLFPPCGLTAASRVGPI